MAGRPVRKAVQVTVLEKDITEACKVFRSLMPSQYAELTPLEIAGNPVGTAWVNALRAIENAEDFLGDLGELLREKAGLTLEEAKARITEPKEAPAEAEAVPAPAGD